MYYIQTVIHITVLRCITSLEQTYGASTINTSNAPSVLLLTLPLYYKFNIN